MAGKRSFTSFRMTGETIQDDSWVRMTVGGVLEDTWRGWRIGGETFRYWMCVCPFTNREGYKLKGLQEEI